MAIGTRVIGGALRGQRIGPLPKNIFARPILARIQKSLFDILKTRLVGASFLDLFSGSGTVGIEAISRGAKKTVFIDANPQCQRWIQRTLEQFSEKNPDFFRKVFYSVHCSNVMSGLKWIGEEFDIIFSGAPYKDEEKNALYFVTRLLSLIEKEQVLKPEGWLIAQHHIKESFEVPESFKFFRQERYGDSVLSFFEYVGNV